MNRTVKSFLTIMVILTLDTLAELAWAPLDGFVIAGALGYYIMEANYVRGNLADLQEQHAALRSSAKTALAAWDRANWLGGAR